MRFHHYARTILASGLFMLASAAHAEEGVQRELGPHVHGRGSLAVAVEGNTVQLELIAPGMDIVGFEHKADTPRQKRAIEAALTDLKDPLSLFQFPDIAECTVASADAKLVADEHGDNDSEHSGADAEEIEDSSHAEFRATYVLTCANASQIKSINFIFFDRFRDSWELDVTFIDADGETAFAVSRNFRYMER